MSTKRSLWHGCGWMAAGLCLWLSVGAAHSQVLSFQSATSSANENATNLTVVVTRTPAAGVATASYLTADVTAFATVDYTATSGTLNFGVGEVFKLITIPILNDFVSEPRKTFEIRLFNVSGATLGITTNVVTIVDDDSFFSFVAPNFTITEGATNLLVTVNRNGSTDNPGSVQLLTLDGTNTPLGAAIGGTDYVSTNVTLSFAAGQTSAVVAIGILDNLLVRVNPQFQLVLTNPVAGQLGAPGAATVTILDNDSTNGTVQISSLVQTVFEGGGTNVTIRVSRVGGTLGQITVDYFPLNNAFLTNLCVLGTNATPGLDYTGGNGTLTWLDGDGTDRFITLTVPDDTLVENNEVIVIGLGRPTGGAVVNLNRTGVVLIISDDQPPGAVDLGFNPATVLNPGPGANNSVYAVAVHTNLSDPNRGSVTIAGDFTAVNAVVRNRIARIFSNGLVDDSFNPGTGADGSVQAVVLQPDGRVVLGGGFTSINNVARRGVARLNVDGSLDASFNPGAGVNGVVNAMLLQADGRVLVGGEFTAVNNTPRIRIARLNADGTLDNTFDAGSGPDGPIYAVAGNFVPPLIAPGVVGSVAGGSGFPATNAIRTHSLGNPGTTVVEVGMFSTTEEMRGVVKFNLAGSQSVPTAVLAFNFLGPGGLLGQTGSVFNIQLEAYAATPPFTGAGLIADYEQPPATAVLANFSSTNFAPGTRLTFDVTTLVNNALAGGTSIGFRLRPTNDPGPDAAVRFGSFALSLGSSGSILVGGSFNSFNQVPRANLIRLSGNGAVDFTFNPVSGPDGAVFAVQLLSTGRILAGGAFQHFDALSRRGVVRLLTNGLPDLTFDPNSGVDGLVRSIGLQTNGQIILGGSFATYSGVPRTNLARLYADGSVETSFLDPFYNSIQPGLNGPVFAVAVQPNNEIVLGGAFTQVGGGGQPTQVVPRLNFARVLGGDVLPVGNMPGNVELISAAFQVDENVPGSVVNVGLRRINGFQGPLVVDYATRDGSAVVGRDYLSRTGTVVFAECDPLGIIQFFAVSILDNGLVDGNRSFQVFLSAPRAPGSLSVPALGFTNTATVTIVDNEFPVGTVGFAAAVYTVSESAGNATISVERTNGTTGIVSVSYAATAGSAVAGQDFTPVSGILTFNSSQTNATFNVTILDDTGVEFEETVNLTLSSPTAGAGLGRARATLLIQDNENGAGTLGFVSGLLTVSESAGSLSVVVVRNSGGAGTVTVQASTMELAPGILGAARAEIDYVSVTTNLTFGPGVTNVAFPVPILTDRLVEGEEVFQLQLSNVTGGGTIGFLASATVTILDNDAYGRLGFAEANFYINERQTNAVITITRVDGASDGVAVDFFTRSGSAVDGLDFMGISNRLTFADGERSKTVLVPLVNDGRLEGVETVLLFLTNFSKALPGLHTNVTLTIYDDEAVSIPAGAVDTSYFSGMGGVVNAVALQLDGQLVAAGDFTNYSGLAVHRIVRVRATGLLDPTFQPGAGANGPVHALALQPGGRLLVAGAFTAFNFTNHAGLTRLNGDGTVDTSFNPGAGTDAEVFAVALQPDGKILIGGAFVTFNGLSRPYLARLLPDGSLDVSFNPGLGPDNRVYAIAVQLDGKILIGGDFTQLNSVARARLARLNADGSLDSSFNPGTGANATVRALLPLPDGSILVGGSFTAFNAVARGGLARVLTNGSLDAAFPVGGAGTDGAVLALARQADGRLLLGGEFTHYNGVTRRRIARLLPDGAADPSINFGLGADSFIGALAVQPDEKIVVAGGFTTFDGARAAYLTRLAGGENLGAGRFEFAAATTTATEGAITVGISVRRLGGLAGVAAVGFNTANGTAVSGTDYTAVSGNLAFPAGEVVQVFQVPLLDNAVLNPDRTVLLQLRTPSGGAALGVLTNALLVIRDDDCTLGFEFATFSVNENIVGGQAVINLVRAGATNLAVSAVFTTTTNGTATAGADFVAVSTLVQFSPGDLVRAVAVPILNDLAPELSETVGLALTNLQFAVLTTATIVPGLTVANLTIVDDEIAPGVFSFGAASFTVAESIGSVTATITVVRSNGASGGIVTVDFQTSDGSARAGQDYLASSGTLAFADGETSKTFAVTVLADLVLENTETVNLTLANPTGGAALGLQNSAVLMIENNNGLIFGNFAFTSASFTNSEGDGAALITVSRLGGSSNAVAVSCATTTSGTAVAGAHYLALTNVLNWAAGDRTDKFFVVPLLNNVLVDGSRTVGLALFNPSNGAGLASPSVATLTILDDDIGPGVLGFGTPLFNVLENATNALVVVTRTNGFTGTVTAQLATFTNVYNRAVGRPNGGPVLPGQDYAVTSVLVTFADGVTIQTVAVPVIDNLVQDGSKTFSVQLTGATGGAALGLSVAVVRILDDEPIAGAVDGGLVSGTGADGTVYSVSVANGGLVLLGGEFTQFNGVPRTGLARLNRDGSLDAGFNPTVVGGGAGSGVRVRAVAGIVSGTNAGKVVLGGLFTTVNGTARTNLARLNEDGSLDSTFAPGLGLNNLVNSLEVQSDGRVIVGGAFTMVGGVSRNFVARLNFDGSLDTSFDPGAGPNGPVRAVALQPDGRVIIVGDFDSVAGVPHRRIARLAANGTVDPTFTPGGLIASGTVFDVAVQLDGEIVVAGQFITTNAVARTNLIRLHANGTLDPNFNLDASLNVGIGPNDFVSAVVAQPDGRILAGGAFTTFNGFDRSRIVRLNGSGTVDPTINFGTGADNLVADIAVQADGKMLLGGAFTTFNGLPQNRFTRLHGGQNAGAGLLVFASPVFNVSESGTNAVITVLRSGGTSNTVSVDYSVINGGSAQAGVDYLSVGGTLFFGEGETLRSFVVPVIDDTAVRPDRTVFLTLSNATGGASLDIPPTAVLRIAENDSLIAFSASTFGIAESGVNALVTVTRSGGSNELVSVDFFTTALSATPGLDYTDVAGTLTFLPGVINQTFTVPVFEDVLVEGSETVSLFLTNAGPIGIAVMGGFTNAILTIVDNDFAVGVLGFAATNFSVFENVGLATVTVSRTNGSSGAVSVSFATVDGQGNATAGVDYLSTNGVLTLADGESSKTFAVRVLDDGFVEGNETLGMVLFGPSGGATLGLTNSTLTIVDDDAFGTFQFSTNSYSVVESAGSVAVTVQRIGGIIGSVSVGVTTEGGSAIANVDYTPVVQLLSFVPGQTSAIVNVTILDDQIAEPLKTVNILLTNAQGGALLGALTNAVISITDDDIQFSFALTNFNVLENSTNAVVNVIRYGVSNLTASVNYATTDGTATNGTDYVGVTNTLVFLPGVTNTNFTVTIIDNQVGQLNRVLNLTLANASPANIASVGTNSTATLTIVDNDNSFNFSATGYNVLESVNTVVVTVFRAGQNSGNVTVDVATTPVAVPNPATAGLDYLAKSETLTFAPGVNAVNFIVTNLNDRLPEGNELFGLVLSNPRPVGEASLGATNTALVSITDDDIGIGFSAAAYTVSESSGAATITVIRAGVTNVAVSVAFTTTNGTALAGVDYAATNAVLLFPAGVNLQTFTVPLVNDTLAESPETVNLVLFNPTGGAFLTISNAVLTIVDNVGSLGFTGTNFLVGESSPNGIVFVARTGGSSGAISVQYLATAGGTATDGLDFASVSGTLSWANGETGPKSFTVPVFNDQLVEPTETIALRLTNPINGASLSISNATLSIVDNDGAGGVDFVFDPGVGFNSTVFALAQQTNGQVIAAGVFTAFNGTSVSRVGRLNIDGTLDTSYNLGLGPDNAVNAVALQADGRLVIAGDFTSVGGVLRGRVARLMADGSLDNTFSSGIGANNSIFTAAIQADGKVVIGGNFTNFNGTARSRVARLNTSGSLDTSFTPTNVNGTVNAIAVYISGTNSGKVLVGGAFTSFNGVSAGRITRLNADGTRDTTFTPVSGANGTVAAIGIQADGRIVIGGLFSSVNGTARSRLARLNHDGSIDGTFLPVMNDSVLALAVQPDGRIVVGGAFTSINGDTGVPPAPGAGVITRARTANVATLTTSGAHNLVPGSLVTIAGVGAGFDGASFKVTATSSSTSFSYANTNANVVPTTVTPVGSFSAVGTRVGRIARFLADGSNDPEFVTGTGTDNLVFAVLVQSDFRVLLAGDFTTLNSAVRGRIARLNGNSNTPITITLGSAGFTGGQFQFVLNAEPGRAYRIDVSTDLRNWIPLITVGSGRGVITFTDTASAGGARRYYRAERVQ